MVNEQYFYSSIFISLTILFQDAVKNRIYYFSAQKKFHVQMTKNKNI